MTAAEVRSRFIAFYKARGHAALQAAPIIPENDPTTLFTSSGMQPLVPYLMGQPHPLGARLVDSQPSFRAEDIDEIGDNRHTTFFEMLGNWSLGDYFKQEQLPWVYEFLTSTGEGLGLDPARLYFSTFAGDPESGMAADDESAVIWKKLGVQDDHLCQYGAKKNWWSRAGVPSAMPAGEIGGPDSEIFFDFGTPHDPAFGDSCHPNCDCGRFIEIGNSVFIQYRKQDDGTFAQLPKLNVDFGGGLERLAAATRGDADIFRIDLFDAARDILEHRSTRKYEDNLRPFRIVLDHMRAAAFFIAAGIHPSASEQGYILRRLIRRALLETDRLGVTGPFLAEIADTYGVAYADTYPRVLGSKEVIREVVVAEETQFRKTLSQGLRELDRMGDDVDAFTLFTTYGFPLELSIEVAKEKGVAVDVDAFRIKMGEHQSLSRAGAAQKFAGGLADHREQTVRYHTAHHLLLKALQEVLGKNVHQRGSNITSERLRIDYSSAQKLTPEQKAKVEEIVNQRIREELPVIRTVMSKAEAEELGAEHEFGASYPDQVTVYSVGPKEATQEEPHFDRAYSLEYCGGPHVTNTRDLSPHGEQFKILKEDASSAGVRRIKAVLE